MAVTDRWHKTYPKLDDPEPDPNLNTNDKSCKCGTAKRPLYPTAEHPRPAQDGKREFKGGKRWQVRYRDEAGKQCSKNFRLKDGDNPDVHAEAFDAKVNAELDSDRYIDPKRSKTTLQDYAAQWRKDLTGDPSTLATIDIRLGHIIDVSAPGKRKSSRRGGEEPPAIASKAIGLLSRRPSLIKAWIKELEGKGLEPYYIQGIAGVLKAIFNSAIDDEAIMKNPLNARSVKLPTVPEKHVIPWTLEQMEAACLCVAGKHPRSEALARLGFEAGHRQGEAFAIALDDIDFLGRKINISRQIRLIDNRLVFSLPKGGKTRSTPLSDPLGLRLAAQIQAFPPIEVTLPWRTPDGPPLTMLLLFVDANGKPWRRDNFNDKLWRPARKAAGVPETRENAYHVSRHTYASALLAAGVDIKTLSVFLGHQDPVITLKIYSHLMPDAADRARKALNAFFSGPSALDVPSTGS